MSLMGTMGPLIKQRAKVTALIPKKHLSKRTMYILRGLKTNILHHQVVKLLGGIYMLGVPKASENIHRGMNQDLVLLESERMALLKV